MVQRYSLFLFIILIAASCKPKREDLLSRKWQEVAAGNAQTTEVMESQQHFIDTVGTHTTPAQNLEAYGMTNIDSFKTMLQANMDSFKAQQQRNIDHTQFDFKKNGVVYIHTELGVDSSAWYFEEDGGLMLDEQKLKGIGSQLRMEIVHLSDTSLKVRFNELNSISTANFVPVKK